MFAFVRRFFGTEARNDRALQQRTEEELRRLEADNLEPGTKIRTTHFFSHFGSSEAERSRFRGELRAARFGTGGTFAEIGTDEELEGDGHWHHWAFTLFESSSDTLRRADELAEAIACDHGVRYDGWQIQRHAPLETGPPLLSDDE